MVASHEEQPSRGSGLIRGLALGGLWGLLWTVVEMASSGLSALAGGLALLTAPCLLGGALGSLIPAGRIGRHPRGLAWALGLLAILFWFGVYGAEELLLSLSFEATTEVAALFATLVLGLALLALALGAWLTRRAPGPARRWAGLPWLVLAVLGAALASRVTHWFLGFEWLTVLAMLGSSALAVAAASASLPGRMLSDRRLVAAVAAAVTLLWALGLILYSLAEGVRATAWRASPMVGTLARSLAALTDADGDGISSALGHPDCDDSDTAVFPGAVDPPGNGRDENCLGGGEADQAAVRALWAPGGARGPTPPADLGGFERRHYNIVLLTIDATRADHTSLHGYERRTTPNLEELGQVSLVFDSAWSASNYTAMSLYSLFTGRYPTAFFHGLDVVATQGLSLPEQLVAAGYHTECYVDFHPPRPQLYAGCRWLDDSMGTRAAAAMRNRYAGSTSLELMALASASVNRLAGLGKPFFIWIHASDPHAEYLAHRAAGIDFGDEELDRYDAEIAFVDRALGRLLGRLAATGKMTDTIIVVSADHGEAFGEHGSFTHGHNLYEEQVHVPLLIYLPGPEGRGFAAARIDAPVDLTDVAPTLYDALGIAPRFPMHGESLLPVVLGGQPLRTPEVFTEVRLPYARAQALRRGRDKLILDHLVGAVHRFDLGRDPGEQDGTTGDAAAAEELGRWIDLHLAYPRLQIEGR